MVSREKLLASVPLLVVATGVGMLLYHAWRNSQQRIVTIAHIQAWVNNGHWEEAEEAIDAYMARTSRPAPVIYLLAGRVRAAKGEFEQAIELLQKVPENSAAYVEALFRRAQIANHLGQRRKAERLFKQVVEVADRRGDLPSQEIRRSAIFELIAMYSLEQRSKEAIPLVWSVYPEHAEPWRLLIALARLQGEPPYVDRAVAELQKAITADPDDWYSHRALAYYNLKGGKFEECIRHAQKALELAPGDLTALAILFQAYVAQENYAAIDQWVRTNEIPRQAPQEFWRALGQAFEAGDRLEEALRYYTKALELAPFDYKNHFAVGSVLIKQGKRKEAEPHMKLFQELKAHYQAIQQFLSNLGDDSQAATWTVPPPQQCVELGRHCLALGRPREATGWAEMALVQDRTYRPAAELLDDALRWDRDAVLRTMLGPTRPESRSGPTG